MKTTDFTNHPEVVKIIELLGITDDAKPDLFKRGAIAA